jgi:cobalamin biosynthesis Mg chelatase CobN
VSGYIHWTITDNWEWADGYCPKFGLYSVDRESDTLKRTARPSAKLYAQVQYGLDSNTFAGGGGGGGSSSSSSNSSSSSSRSRSSNSSRSSSRSSRIQTLKRTARPSAKLYAQVRRVHPAAAAAVTVAVLLVVVLIVVVVVFRFERGPHAPRQSYTRRCPNTRMHTIRVNPRRS